MGWDFKDRGLRFLMAVFIAVSFLPFSLLLAFVMSFAGIHIGLGAFFASELIALAGAYVYLTLASKG